MRWAWGVCVCGSQTPTSVLQELASIGSKEAKTWLKERSECAQLAAECSASSTSRQTSLENHAIKRIKTDQQINLKEARALFMLMTPQLAYNFPRNPWFQRYEAMLGVPSSVTFGSHALVDSELPMLYRKALSCKDQVL